MRVAGEDEGIDSECAVATDLFRHLAGRADDRGSATAAGPADAGPQVVFGEAVARSRLAQFGLSADTDALRVERTGANARAFLVVDGRDQMFGGFDRFSFGVAHDDVAAVAESQDATVTGRPIAHVVDRCRNVRFDVGPHQVDVCSRRRHFAGFLAEATEVEQWILRALDRDAGWFDVQRVELTVEVEAFAPHQRANRCHHLESPSVTSGSVERLARHLRRDDVDRESAAEGVVEGGELTSELRCPYLAAAHGDEQPDPRGERGDGRSKRHGVDAEGIAGRKEDVIETGTFGVEDDVATVFPAAAQVGPRHSQLFVVVVAECPEPREFGGRHRRVHGNGTPSLATMMR